MVKLLPALIFLSVIASVFSSSPGLVATIRKPIIDKARDKYFESVFDALGVQELPDFKDGDIGVSKIEVKLANQSPENLVVSFKKDINSINVAIENTKVHIHCYWKYSKVLLSLSGDADITGTLSGISLDIPMELTVGNFHLPVIDVKNFDLNMNKNLFSVKLRCSGCPGAVESLLTSFMKDNMLTKVSNQIQSQVPTQIRSMANTLLLNGYPRVLNLYDRVAFSTELERSILIEEDHLEVHFDGTIYDPEEGYIRPGQTPEMPTFNEEDPGEIMMFFSSYLTDTLTTTLNKNVQTYSSKLLGISYTATLDPEVAQSKVGLEDGDLVLNMHPKIVTKLLKIGVEFGAQIKLKLKIKNGNNHNMMTISPSIKKWNLDSLKLIVGGFPIDVKFIDFLLHPFVRLFLNWVLIPNIKIPKSDLLPLTVTNNLLEFHKEYAELGILFSFTS